MTVTFTSEEITLIISLIAGILALSFTGYLLAKKEYEAISIWLVSAFALHTIVDLIKLIVIWCK